MNPHCSLKKEEKVCSMFRILLLTAPTNLSCVGTVELYSDIEWNMFSQSREPLVPTTYLCYGNSLSAALSISSQRVSCRCVSDTTVYYALHIHNTTVNSC